VTNPADVTKSIGLLANALLSWFLQRHLDYFIMTRNCSSIYQDLVPSRQLHRDTKRMSFFQDWQKKRHRDADGIKPPGL